MEPQPKKHKTTVVAVTTKTSSAATTTTLLDIPDDCWKQILSYIDNLHNPHFHIHQNHRQSLSATCKHLLSAINRLPFSLPVTTALISHPDLLRRMLRRFSTSLQSIDLTPYFENVNVALSALVDEHAATSGLRCLSSVRVPFYLRVPNEGLRRLAEVCHGLKVLEIVGCWILSDDHLIEICNLFCQIEEIDVSRESGISTSGQTEFLTDVCIVYLSKKLKFLKKINVSEHPKITDVSLVALSDHCLSLSDVTVCQCNSVIQHGVGYMLPHCSKLEHLSVSCVVAPVADASLSLPCYSIKDSVGFSRSLSSLELSYMDDEVIEDSFLVSLARAKLPLKNFSIYSRQTFTIQGLTAFLGAYPNLEGLELYGTMFLTYKVVEGLVCYFKRLTVVKLGCCELTESTLYLLLKCCPVLEEVWMDNSLLGEGELSEVVVQNRSIKYLNLSENSGLTDEKLQAIGLMCPNSVQLDVDGCRELTSKGIGGVLESCCEIKHLSVKNFSGPKLFDEDLECSRFKIELLQLEDSKIDDDGLSGIARACPNLMLLNIKGCQFITSTGVEEVVRCCTRLENICLADGSASMTHDIVRWMVLARPSLKKIVPRFIYRPSSSDKEVFFKHGCSVKPRAH